MNKPLFVICGPTATGKTEYALKLAKEKNGELVSCDSRQVYKYLDIGTAKDLPENSKFEIRNSKFEGKNKNYTIGHHTVSNTPLWLYDIISPDQLFSAFEYAQIARDVIADIWDRGKLPILIGGTGLYIKAVTDGFDTEGIPKNKQLRRKLETCSLKKLQSTLISLSTPRFKSMNRSDRNNPRRLVRAIEVAKQKEKGKRKKEKLQLKTKNLTFIGLEVQREKLYQRIDKRVEKRMKEGMLNEIKSVLKSGYVWDDPGLNTIGYKQLRPYFEKKETLDEAIQKWKYAEHAYARRQMIWFNKDNRIQWIVK